MVDPPTPLSNLATYLKVQQATDRKLAALYRQAARDATRQLAQILGDGPGDLVRRDQVLAARAEVQARAAALLRKTGDLVAAGKLDAAAAADRNAQRYDEFLMRTVRDDPAVRAYLAGHQAASRTAVDLAERRLLGRGYVPLSEQVYRTATVTAGIVDSAINSAVARGLSAREFAAEVVGLIDPATPGGASYAASRLARTELNNAFHARSVDDARDRPWVTGMRWTLSGSHPRPDACNDYAEHDDSHGLGVYAVDDVPEKPHPHCFPAGTLVRPYGAVLAATKRWHSGGLVDVVLAEGGGELSGTPNHPALTLRGWVPLSELREGDHVVRDRVERPAVDDPHEQHVPTRIEDVAGALGVAGRVASARVPAAAEQFHGDGSVHGHVEVVGAARLLQRHRHAVELPRRGQVAGSVGRRAGGFLVPQRDLVTVGGGLLRAADRGMGREEPLRALLGRFDVSGLLAGPHREAARAEHQPNHAGTTADDPRRLVQRLAGQVDVYRVQSVSFRPRWSGHVYNLQSQDGFYTANGLVVHNCLCVITEVETGEYDSPATGKGRKPDEPPADPEGDWLDRFFAGDYDDYIDAHRGATGVASTPDLLAKVRAAR